MAGPRQSPAPFLSEPSEGSLLGVLGLAGGRPSQSVESPPRRLGTDWRRAAPPHPPWRMTSEERVNINSGPILAIPSPHKSLTGPASALLQHQHENISQSGFLCSTFSQVSSLTCKSCDIRPILENHLKHLAGTSFCCAVRNLK